MNGGRVSIDLTRLKDGEAIYVYQEKGDNVEFTYNGSAILWIDKTENGDIITPPSYNSTKLNNSVKVENTREINTYREYKHKDFTFSVGSTIIKKNKIPKNNSIIKKAYASDYIAIKRQNAIFTGNNTNNMVINADENCCSKNPPQTICKVRKSNSYEMINNFYDGQKYNKKFCE